MQLGFHYVGLDLSLLRVHLHEQYVFERYQWESAGATKRPLAVYMLRKIGLTFFSLSHTWLRKRFWLILISFMWL